MKLQKLSLFGAVTGALILTSAFAPRANALPTQLLTYYNFNSSFGALPYNSNGGTNETQHTTITNESFPTGGTSVDQFFPPHPPGQNAGSTVNALFGDPRGGALNLAGNTTGSAKFCFVMGPLNTTGSLAAASLSFAISRLGSAGAFSTLTLTWGTATISGGLATFTAGTGGSGNIDTINLTTLSYTGDNGYALVTENNKLPTGQTNLYVEFCFSGSTNTDTNNRVLIDNIQVNGFIPEPSTYIGGLLGIGVCCWSQRRSLLRFLRLRRA
jgi:hypothetical protein